MTYTAKTGPNEGLPLPGMEATTPDNLPTIDDYQEVSDVPLVYNEMAVSVQDALNVRLSQTSPSSASAVAGFRRITVSTSPPSGGVDGDVWLQREA